MNSLPLSHQGLLFENQIFFLFYILSLLLLLLLSHFSLVRLCVTPEMAAHQAPLFMGFFRQEYWSELPFPPPGDLPNPGTEPTSPVSPALASGFFTNEPTGKPKKPERKP